MKDGMSEMCELSVGGYCFETMKKLMNEKMRGYVWTERVVKDKFSSEGGRA